MTAVISTSDSTSGLPSGFPPSGGGGFPDHDRLADLVTRMRAGDRDAAAEFMVEYGPLLRRRVRGKLGAAMRRLFDSQEILSTVGRRLDRYVRVGGLEAESPGQLLQLVFRMAEGAVIDKVRVFKRLERMEGEDSRFAQEFVSRLHDADNLEDDGAVISLDEALRALTNETDRQILTMWLNGTQHSVIAWDLGMTPAAVRQRWKTIRDRLKESLQLGTIHPGASRMVSIATDAVNALRRAHSERSGDVDLRAFLFRFPELDDDELADLIELDARERLHAGLGVELPRYLEAIPDLSSRHVALDAAIEFALRSLSGSRHTKIEAVEALCEAYPDLVPAISAAWFLNDALGSTTGATALVQQPVTLHLPASIGPLLPSGKHRYDLRERLGVGSHGSVYLAVDHALSESDRPAWVAVKVTPALNPSHALAHRVMEEATKARRVLHPNIARVLDRGPMDGGGEFIVYEHVDAGDLQNAHDRGRLPQDPRSLAALVAKIARAVQAAHSAGLIHSDLKPSNILLTSAGEPKVGDFGLAARRFDLGENSDGVQLGTLGFIAPERYHAEPGSEGVQSDVYSLGGILYYLLTGKAPNGDTADEVAERFGSDTSAASIAHLESLNDRVDPDLAAICARALAPLQQNRYPSADAFAGDLKAWLEHRPLAWRHPGPAKVAKLFCRRNPLLTSAGALFVVTLVGAAAAFVQLRSNQHQRLMQAALDRAADIQNEQQRANQSVDKLVLSMVGALKHDKGDIEDNWLPLLTITEAVAGPLLLDSSSNADFEQMWGERVNVARALIGKAKDEGRQDDSGVLMWRIGLGYWLLHDGEFSSARQELDSALAVWQQRNGPKDSWSIYASTLAACAEILKAQKSLSGAPPSEDAAARIQSAADRIESSFQAIDGCKNIRRQALIALTTAYSPSLLNRPDLNKKYDDLLRPR